MENNLSLLESDVVPVALTRKDVRTNTVLWDSVKKTLNILTEASNLNVQLDYIAAEKKFKFAFPVNDLLNVSLHPSQDLANRLGFNLISNITKMNAKSTEKCEDTPDLVDAEKKARAMAYDTSIVIVSNEYSSSMMTAGISEQFMASLMPTWSGTLKLSPISDTLPKMRLSNVYSGSSDTVPATFRLHRYLDHENLVNFQWRHDAYIYGVLQGSI
jgi:hypothetical protein